MKKLHHQRHQMKRYIILALMMVLVSVIPAMAEDTISTVIDLSEIVDEKFDAKQHYFKYWYIAEEKVSNEAAELEKKTLDDLSESELDDEYMRYFITEKPGEDKRITLKELEGGTYYFRDMSEEPNELKVDSFLLPLPLSENEENTVKPVLEVQKPEKPAEEKAEQKLIVKLTSENGKALKGGEFKLFQKKDSILVPVPIKDGHYDVEGSIEYTFTTNDKGEFTVDKLPESNYAFRQIKAPEGYEIIKVEHEFTTVDRRSNVIEVVNKAHLKQGDHHFLKYDKANNALLEGAIFKVTTYDEVAKKYNAVSRDGKDYTITSGEKGQFTAKNLPYGTYYLVEIQAPKGYKLSSDPIKFTINGQSHKKRIDIANEKLVVSSGTGKGSSGSSKSGSSNSGKIPKTGDVFLPILVLSGVTLAIGGRNLIKREDK